MRKLSSSFSIKQKPKPNDLIVGINANKEILFSKSKQTFMHENTFEQEFQNFKIFQIGQNSDFLTTELNVYDPDLIYLSKKHMYPYLTYE